ncbi:MAG: hypothetical protein KatS3mg118_1883 [Paracoccaceae bacterium]|nr:MAG: hypothetical protein KatS3mg118_1883 [Paracoccaceae bacterium]
MTALPFPRLAARDAALHEWDAVVAGSSFSAMFFLRGLPRHWRILLVEKGPHIPHADQLASRSLPAETIAQDNRSGRPKEWTLHGIFGGNSNCWWGQTPRWHPDDFRLGTLSGHGPDWPIGYDDLEPYWQEVEQVMEVAGGGTDHILPRSAPFPYPPHQPSRSDSALRAADPLWTPAPSARANGGRLGQCCANGVCDLCPVDAKFTVLNAGGAFDHPRRPHDRGGAARNSGRGPARQGPRSCARIRARSRSAPRCSRWARGRCTTPPS